MKVNEVKFVGKLFLKRSNNSMFKPKKNILKIASFDVMQTVFFAFTCKFGLVL